MMTWTWRGERKEGALREESRGIDCGFLTSRLEFELLEMRN